MNELYIKLFGGIIQLFVLFSIIQKGHCVDTLLYSCADAWLSICKSETKICGARGKFKIRAW